MSEAAESHNNINSESNEQSNKVPLRLEQAAIVLLSIGEEAAAQVMSKMSREEVLRLSETMARLSGVKLTHARLAMNNFFQEYREQSGINGASRSYLRNILERALGGEIARSVINGIYGDEIRHRMARLQWVDTPQLAAMISQEHLQMQAVFLAFLPPDVAAGVLAQLDESRQDEILYRVARLDDINRDVVDELDRLIDRGVAVLSEHGSKVQGIRQAANIVNRISGNQQVLLSQLELRDESVVDELKSEMYEFFILSRQNSAVLQRLLEEVSMDQWAVALKGTEPVLRQVIYDAMPRRQVQLLQSTTSRLGPVPISRIEQVRKEIMARVRELAESGEIQIQLFSEQTVE